MAKTRKVKSKATAKSKRPRRAAPKNQVDLTALHREFDKVQKQLDAALRRSPSSVNFQTLQANLTTAVSLMRCQQGVMVIFAV